MDIKAEIGRHTDEAEQIITSYLPEEKGYQKTVIEAMNYSFLAGGKRLRPILMLETYRLFGGKSKVIRTQAVHRTIHRRDSRKNRLTE